MKTILKMVGRSLLLFMILFITFLAGGLLGTILPEPEKRYIFTPGNELGFGVLLFAVSFTLGQSTRVRVCDLLLACIIAQLFVGIVVAVFAGVSWDFYFHWLWRITRSITPPIALGMGLGFMIRLIQKRETG